MPRWFDETILIKYWEDRCAFYRLQDGTRLQSASRNPAFGRYPDIALNYLSDGRVVPCEIEWVTSNFDRHGHDITELREERGFLVVMARDSGFPIEQIELDQDDFLAWLVDNAEYLGRETLAEILTMSARSGEPQIYLFHVPIAGNRNFNIAFDRGVWGFPSNARGVRRGLSKIAQIKKNDIVVFIRNWKSDASVRVSGGRVSAEKYVGKFKEIVGVVVTRGYFESSSPEYWDDNDYPYRFKFRKEPLFHGTDVPCNQRALGKSLHEILRRTQVNGSIEMIDTSLIVKLMSLCTKG